MNEMYIVSFNSTHHAIRLDKLLGEALNTLDIVDGKIASITITKEMLKRNVISFNDASGSRVPVCPTFFVFKIFLTALTTS